MARHFQSASTSFPKFRKSFQASFARRPGQQAKPLRVASSKPEAPRQTLSNPVKVKTEV